jgi:hypothetical protein
MSITERAVRSEAGGLIGMRRTARAAAARAQSVGIILPAVLSDADAPPM